MTLISRKDIAPFITISGTPTEIQSIRPKSTVILNAQSPGVMANTMQGDGANHITGDGSSVEWCGTIGEY